MHMSRLSYQSKSSAPAPNTRLSLQLAHRPPCPEPQTAYPMGSRKKRKSVGAAEEPPATKRPGSQQGRRSTGGGGGGGSALAWGADGVTVTLSPSQALMFLGRAVLEVQHGEVAALGAVLTPASGPVEVAADRCGGALLLEPGAAQGTVPLASPGGASFTLKRLPAGSESAVLPGPPATPQRQQQAGSASADDASSISPGFEAWLAGEPGAPPAPPPLPPLWRQAAAEVEESLAEAAAAGGGAQPPVIVVAGAKKVGKSSFARFLLNGLLARHGCVAYLDTGGCWGWGGGEVGR